MYNKSLNNFVKIKKMFSASQKNITDMFLQFKILQMVIHTISSELLITIIKFCVFFCEHPRKESIFFKIVW